MLRFVTTLAATALAAVLSLGLDSAVAQGQPVALDARSAGRALDAVPAVFAVAQNVEGVDIDVSVDSMVGGFGDLAGEAAAQEMLVGALGAYDFESYEDWATTIRAIFSIYAFIQADAANGDGAPAIASALQRVLDDPGMPQSQKDAIAAHMDGAKTAVASTPAVTPSEANLAVVIGLGPQIEATIAMMRAMQ